MQMVRHHVKYKEIHGVDEIIIISRSEHSKIHQRLRREGKCNIPVDKLKTISDVANFRRRFGGMVFQEWKAWEKFRAFEKINAGWVYKEPKDILF